MLEEYGDIAFREVQRFGGWFRLFVAGSLVAAAGLGGYATAMSLIEEPANMVAAVISVSCGVVMPLGIVVLFWINRLETEVRADGLYIRFFPFHLRFKRFAGEDLVECYARRYRPIMEYGGWGLRYGWKGGWAYNVSGNEGVQLVFNNGKKLLVGSQEAEGLETAIRSTMGHHRN